MLPLYLHSVLPSFEVVRVGHVVRASVATDLCSHWPGRAEAVARTAFADAADGVLVLDVDGDWELEQGLEVVETGRL